MFKGKLSLALCASLLTFGLMPDWGRLEQTNWVFAQDASPKATFPLPETIPDGTTIKIETSDSMQEIAEAVKGGFIERYQGSNATVKVEETNTAIKDLADGKIDVAAIGRPLTQAEKNQGLIAVPVARHKIAMIVGVDNPFEGSLTIEDFAKIFRGEIQNWSEVKGTEGAIKLIDRPDTSDTRQAFLTYPVFQSAPFQASETAESVAEDNTDLVIEKLGADGISYAIYDQVANNPRVKIVKMYDTLPDNPDYPFSQPLYFVYKGPNASEPVQALLGYTTGATSQEAIETARASRYAQATPTPEESPTVTPPVVEEEERGGFPWWLLLLPLLAIPLFFLLRNQDEEPEPVGAIVPPPAPPVPACRLILTPRDCRDAYAYWEVSDAHRADLKGQGSDNLVLRIYDVTDIDIDHQTPHSVEEYGLSGDTNDYHVPIARDDRDYMAELGYLTTDNRFLSLARSLHVRVPPCSPPEPLIGEDAVIAPPLPVTESIAPNRLILTPRGCREAYAYWEVPDADKANLKAQGGENLVLRIYDVTNIDIDHQPPHNVQEYFFLEDTNDYQVPIAQDDRDYMAELGYSTTDNRFLSLARSLHVRVPPCPPDVDESFVDEIPTLNQGFDVADTVFLQEDLETDEPSFVSFTEVPADTLTLVARSSQEAYVSWQVSETAKEILRQQGGEQFILRLYDLTDANNDGKPDSVWDHECSELDSERIIPLYYGDRHYQAELGYRTAEGRWLPLVQSNPMYLPPKVEEG